MRESMQEIVYNRFFSRILRELLIKYDTLQSKIYWVSKFSWVCMNWTVMSLVVCHITDMRMLCQSFSCCQSLILELSVSLGRVMKITEKKRYCVIAERDKTHVQCLRRRKKGEKRIGLEFGWTSERMKTAGGIPNSSEYKWNPWKRHKKRVIILSFFLVEKHYFLVNIFSMASPF